MEVSAFSECFLSCSYNFVNRSKLECAKACSNDDQCRTWTSTRLTSSQVQCRAHSQEVTESVGTSELSTLVYRGKTSLGIKLNILLMRHL